MSEPIIRSKIGDMYEKKAAEGGVSTFTDDEMDEIDKGIREDMEPFLLELKRKGGQSDLDLPPVNLTDRQV